MSYDPAQTAAFYDEYGEREWTRFEDGRTPAPSLAIHTDFLHRFVRAGDRVLDVGAGPGRFTIELARIGADVVVADLSPRQLELNRERVEAAGGEERVLERVVADVIDLSRFPDASFDASVCFGGPLSYLLHRAETGVAELVRVTRPGGHVLLSVMSLVGTIVHFLPQIVELARNDGVELNEDIVRTGLLPRRGDDYGHLPMKLYRWSELEALVERHATIVGRAAAGLLPHLVPEEQELREFLIGVERALAEEPGALSSGQHILVALQVP